MKISKSIVDETLKVMEETGPIVVPLIMGFKKIREENPHVGEFIDAVLETWKEKPPPTLNDQLSVLFINLVAFADMFRRQEEVDKLEKKFGK